MIDCKAIQCTYYQDGKCMFKDGCKYVPVKPVDWKK